MGRVCSSRSSRRATAYFHAEAGTLGERGDTALSRWRGLGPAFRRRAQPSADPRRGGGTYRWQPSVISFLTTYRNEGRRRGECERRQAGLDADDERTWGSPVVQRLAVESPRYRVRVPGVGPCCPMKCRGDLEGAPDALCQGCGEAAERHLGVRQVGSSPKLRFSGCRWLKQVGSPLWRPSAAPGPLGAGAGATRRRPAWRCRQSEDGLGLPTRGGRPIGDRVRRT